MVKQFQIKKLLNDDQITNLVHKYGLNRQSKDEIQAALDAAFEPYILSTLAEMNGSIEEHRKLYIEASFHINKAQQLLTDLPHPAGKMSSRLESMQSTLNKLVDGSIGNAAERANRFMEKNLVRRLRDIWIANTPTPFHVGGDGSGKNPRDFLVDCFAAVSQVYPQITWFNALHPREADLMIKAIKR